ncbi:MAG: TolC family protein [Firmicutes bacterium]|nr:TolC family protein [Bacillota bacterium]
MRKKALYGLCCWILVGLLLTPALPAAGYQELSLDQALEMGLAANYAIKRAKLTWENARLNYEKNKAVQPLTGSRSSELQLELNMLQAEENYRRTKDQALLAIARQYLEVLKTEQERTWRRKQLEREEMTLRLLEQQVAQGYETRLALIQQENKYHNARQELKTLEDNYDLLAQELAVAIGWQAGVPVPRLKPVNTALTWELSEDDCLNIALTNSRSLRVAGLEVDLAQLALDRAKIGAILPVELQELENNLALATLRRDETRWELENSVRQQYRALTRLAENLTLNENHLATVRENFAKVQQQHKVGLLKEVDRLAAEAELLQAEYQMLTAVTNYQLKKWEFQQLLGLDLEV